MNATETDPADQRAHLLELLKEFHTGVLTTTGLDGGLHARPLAVAQANDDGTLWFSTHAVSAKVEEIAKRQRVGVTFQSKTVYLAFSGEAEVVNDREKIKELWAESWRIWYPDGPTDPNIALLKIELERGEYWDMNGVSGIKFLFQAAKAYVSGRAAEDGGPDQHGAVKDLNR